MLGMLLQREVVIGEAAGAGPHCGLRPVADIQLAQNGLYVDFHGCFADVEFARDDLV